mgnify:CR=1 FL=1
MQIVLLKLFSVKWVTLQKEKKQDYRSANISEKSTIKV